MIEQTFANGGSHMRWRRGCAPGAKQKHAPQSAYRTALGEFCRLVSTTVRLPALLWAFAIMLSAVSHAYPPDPPSPPGATSDDDLIRPFPIVVPTPSNWVPKFPFPYDQTKDRVTVQDITAMSELCQWYNMQYATLRDQIDRLQFNRIGTDGKDFDYSRDNLQEQVDIVAGNLDKSLDFLGPRVLTLTQAQNTFGDIYFPIYEGEAFYKLWEQLSNVNNGIRAHQPDWFTGPSVQKAKRWGSDIHRSHVCR